MKWLLAVVVLTACDRRPAVMSCEDDLHGVWRTPRGERWVVLDHGERLEAFALFDDAVADGAPRVIDLARGEPFAGEVKRRYSRGGAHCEARAPIRLTTCRDNELALVMIDPQPPRAFLPCRWGAPPKARVERWRRE